MAKGMVSGVRMPTFKHWFCLVPEKVIHSCLTLCNPMDYTVHGILQARILEWVLFLLLGAFPTQGLNPGLPHCRQILNQLSHQKSHIWFPVRWQISKKNPNPVRIYWIKEIVRNPWGDKMAKVPVRENRNPEQKRTEYYHEWETKWRRIFRFSLSPTPRGSEWAIVLPFAS